MGLGERCEIVRVRNGNGESVRQYMYTWTRNPINRPKKGSDGEVYKASQGNTIHEYNTTERKVGGKAWSRLYRSWLSPGFMLGMGVDELHCTGPDWGGRRRQR